MVEKTHGDQDLTKQLTKYI